jgi:hypothetical protein
MTTNYNLSCGQCDAKLKTKKCLEKHIKYVHCDARPFICNNCEKSYVTKGDLLKHIKAKHLCR